MKHSITCLAALLMSAGVASATELIYSTGWSGYTAIDSQLCTSPALASEAADDFDLVGLVERVYVTGHNSSFFGTPDVLGARVRFFEWTAQGPGTQQAEYFVPAGDPGLAYDPTNVEDVDVTLPQPFLATGKHFVSVQLEMADCFYWAYWIANKDAPIGSPAYRRTSGGAWSQVTAFDMASSDLSFSLFGIVGPPKPLLGCGVWSVQPSPDAPGASKTFLNDMEYLASDDIWAVGRGYGQFTPGDFNQLTFAMHYDGSEWSVVPTPNPNPAPELTYCELNAVAALSSTDVWAAGTKVDQDPATGYVGLHNLVQHWDGSSWVTVPTPIPGSIGLQGVSGDGIYDMLALAPDNIWFFGEWIRIDAQSHTIRQALAMHYDGSSFTVDEDFPVVGGNGATILASDALSADDIWAVGQAGDGDPAVGNQSFIFHWDGSDWTHLPAPPVPGYQHVLGDVKAFAPNDVWISGSSWAPPNTVTQFMLHWNGSNYDFTQVPFAGGSIVGAPPEMYVFGSGGVSLYDGSSFTDAHLLDGLESLAGFGFADVVQTGPCEMIAAGNQFIAGNAHSLIARLGPADWTDLGLSKGGIGAPPAQLASGTLAPDTSNMVALTGARPSAPAVLIVGLSTLDAPFKGGTLVPTPTLLLPLVTSIKGAAGLPFDWPAAVPFGTAIYFQFWVKDATASQGFTASNALRGVSG